MANKEYKYLTLDEVKGVYYQQPIAPQDYKGVCVNATNTSYVRNKTPEDKAGWGVTWYKWSLPIQDATFAIVPNTDIYPNDTAITNGSGVILVKGDVTKITYNQTKKEINGWNYPEGETTTAEITAERFRRVTIKNETYSLFTNSPGSNLIDINDNIDRLKRNIENAIEIYKDDVKPIKVEIYNDQTQDRGFIDSDKPVICLTDLGYQKLYDIINNNASWNIEKLLNINTDWTLAVDGTKSPLYKLKWKCASISSSDIARVRIGYGGYDVLSGKVSIHKWQLVDYSPSSFKTNYAQINNAVWGEIANIVSPIATLATVYIAVQLEYYSTPTVLPSDTSSIMYCELFKNEKNGHMYGDIGFLEKDENGLYNKVTTGDGSTFTVKDGEDGSKIVTDDDDDGYSDDKDDDENDNDTSNVSTGIGVLTTTFKMTKDRLQQLGRFLWGSNIFDNFSLICNNPIENIISCKSIPLSLDGTTQKIILGNVDTGVNGDKVANNFTSQTIGSIKITEKYNNFLDYSPYTNVIIYLPYVGFKELDTNLVMNKTLSISYTVDVITGGCLCQIKSDGVRLYEFNGNLGIDIPITASNRAQVEAGYISSGIGIASSAASGNIVGAVTSLINSAEAQYHYASTSSPNPMCVASTNRTCYVIIDRPTYQTLKSFNHTRGKKCYLTKTINTLKGYTICDEHVDLSGIRATESEKEELIRLLSSGFFVN